MAPNFYPAILAKCIVSVPRASFPRNMLTIFLIEIVTVTYNRAYAKLTNVILSHV